MSDYFLSIDKTKFEKFGSLSWSDDIESYTTIIKFSSQTKFNVGRQFILNNGINKLFKGIISNIVYDRDLIYDYTAYDYGFYLSRNELSIKFDNVQIEDAIKMILGSVSIPFGEIKDVKGTVKKPYKKQTIKAILDDLLKLATGQTGIKYVVDCSLGEINIKSVYKIDDVRGELSQDFYINSAENLGNAKITNDIDNLRNSIVIYDGSFNVNVFSVDNASIKKFGVLQEVVEPDNNANNYQIITNNTLLDRNKVKTTIEVDILGDDRIKKGTIISIKDTVVNVVGDYLVTKSNHSVENGVHSVHCSLELYQ